VSHFKCNANNPLGASKLLLAHIMGMMDIYEVELCRRGSWEQQYAWFVAAGDGHEAAYKVTGSICTAEANAGKFGYASEGLGTEARRSCFRPPDAHLVGVADRRERNGAQKKPQESLCAEADDKWRLRCHPARSGKQLFDPGSRGLKVVALERRHEPVAEPAA
jgi:hypothetical protein